MDIWELYNKFKKGFRSNHATHSYYLIGKDALKLYRKSQFEDGPFEILNKIGISNIYL